MNIKLQRYFLIGLLFSSIPSLSYATMIRWDLYGIEFVSNEALDVEFCDYVLDTIIVDIFFNQKDQSPFSMIISMLIEVLTMKKNLLPCPEHEKYNEVINFLKENKNCKVFKTWAMFLPAPELRQLLSKKTQDFINNTPLFQLIKTLNQKINY